MDNHSDYYLLLADIRGSTNLSAPEGAAVMEYLIPQLERQNRLRAQELVYPLEINYGDEFAGLFSGPASLYRTIREIRDELHGVAEFRFVAAHGRVGYAEGSIREMGGPVFDTASRALNRAKKTRKFGTWQIADTAMNAALNALTNAADSLIAEMTDYQYQVFRHFRSGLKGVEIAERLQKDARSVSKAKSTGHAQTVIDIESAIDGLLDHLAKPAPRRAANV